MTCPFMVCKVVELSHEWIYFNAKDDGGKEARWRHSQPRIDGEREVTPTTPIVRSTVGVELVNARELARVLAVSERTLYRLERTLEFRPSLAWRECSLAAR